MHELSLCQSIIDTLQQQAAVHHYSKVKEVRLEIGPFAAVDISALRFAFEVATRDTLAEGARLAIHSPEAIAYCTECECEVVIEQRYDACPHCGATGLRLISGDALQIKDLEVE